MAPSGKLLPLSKIQTRQPDSANWHMVTLGGTNLYAQDEKAMHVAIDRLEAAIDSALRAHFCLIRQVLHSVVKRELGEIVPDRIFGAVLGRALHSGRIMAIGCLTINSKVLRTHLHASTYPELTSKLKTLAGLLKSQTAVSVLTAQSACFPNREWGTTYMAQQLLGHLALRGLTVYVDKDLFLWPKDIDNAVSTFDK